MTDAQNAPVGRTTVLDDAYELLAKTGPLVGSSTVSLAGAAKALGISRNQLYRHWPTSAEMALDLALFQATPTTGWHAQICTDDGGPLAEALRRSLASRSSADGVLTRASIAVQRDSTALPRLAAWERAHLANLAARLRREWGHEGSGPWTDIAIVLASLMDGMHLMCAQFAEEPGALMPAPLADEVTQLALRMVDFLLHEVEGLDLPMDSGDGDPEPTGEAVQLPARIAAALAEGALVPADTGRVIDMGVLARSRGVSERSLYSRWPTPTDLKADLFTESLERSRRAFARITLAFFQAHNSGAFTHTMASMASMNSLFMDPGRFPEATIHLGITEVLSEAAVLDRVREPVEVALENADVQSAALLLAGGLRLRSDVRMRSYTMFSVGMGMGSHRTTATHPDNPNRRLRYLGEEYLAAGVGHTAMTHSATEPSDPSPPPGPRSVRVGAGQVPASGADSPTSARYATRSARLAR